MDYTPAVVVRRKSTDVTDVPAIPQAAFEAPTHHQPPPGSSGGGGGGGGGGISSSPPVTAWAIPSDSIPETTAKLSPEEYSQGRGGGGGGAAGGGGAGMPSHYTPNERETDPYQESRRVDALPGGFEAAVQGWNPSESGGVKHDGGAEGGGKYDSNTPPPPYTRTPSQYDHNDIPSPPHTRPVIFDIPAAPG